MGSSKLEAFCGSWQAEGERLVVSRSEGGLRVGAVGPEVCEALLRLKYGPWIICHVVANQPDSFLDGKSDL